MKSKGEIVNMQSVIDGLMRQLEGKDHMIQHLLDKVDELESTIKAMSQNIERMSGIISTYERRLYGTSSEKRHRGRKKKDDDNEAANDNGSSEDSVEESEEDESGEGIVACRKKPYTHPHKRDYSDVPIEEVIEIHPDEEEIKGARLVKVTDSYRFLYIPGRLVKIQYKRYSYCKDGHLITPKLPYVPEDLEKRHATPALIASLLVNKYLYHIPIERQMEMLNQGEIQIAKTTLHNWTTAGIDSIDGVYEAIREKVLSDNRLHIDETTMPVVDTENHCTKKGYDWGFISPTHKMMFFARMNGSRGKEVLDAQLKDYKGLYIQHDGYGAYINVGERLKRTIINIPCLAHMKRKFVDSISNHRIKAEEGLEYIDAIFHNEKTYKDQNLEPYIIEAKREIELRPLLDAFKKWLKDQVCAVGFFAESNIGKAITYALERIDGLYVVIKNGLLDVSNNMAERTMRGHAMGRNNYLFCQNEKSAERTCKIYTIIESCKLSKVDPYRYLCEILSRKPIDGETWEQMLPSNIKFA